MGSSHFGTRLSRCVQIKETFYNILSLDEWELVESVDDEEHGRDAK